MEQPFQNIPSNHTFSLPYKRKRGRPRKDQSMNRLAITTVPPGFAGLNEKLPQRGHPTNDSNDAMVGHAVTGTIEAAFDAGYLLSARIGNSIFRGVVFKPGHIAPVTVENDVAPHVPVIRRKDIHVPANNRPRNTTVQNGSTSTNQWLALRHRTTSMTTTTKGKYASPIQTIFPVGARGTVVPVVLQPASLSNNFTPTPQTTPPSSRDSGVNDVSHTAEPLAMLPYDASCQTPMGQNQTLPSQIHVNQQGAQAGAMNGNISFAGATIANQEEIKQPQSAETLAQDDPDKGLQDSHPPSEIQDHKTSESNVSHGHPTQNVDPSLSNPSITVSQPLGRYPTGRMTELLLALQENMENQVCHAEPPSSTSTADHDEESGE